MALTLIHYYLELILRYSHTGALNAPAAKYNEVPMCCVHEMIIGFVANI